jgi:hypothetical protein
MPIVAEIMNAKNLMTQYKKFMILRKGQASKQGSIIRRLATLV